MLTASLGSPYSNQVLTPHSNTEIIEAILATSDEALFRLQGLLGINEDDDDIDSIRNAIYAEYQVQDFASVRNKKNVTLNESFLSSVLWICDEAISAIERNNTKLAISFLCAATQWLATEKASKYYKKKYEKIIPQITSRLNSERAKHAADCRHDKPNGSRDKAEKIRAIWATGKYFHRSICAEEEYNALGYNSYETARKALRNTPEPTR
jgi:hypothetical protein